MQIIDLPPVKNFPRDSLEEWNNCKGYGLRQASAFLLVFDVSSPDSFATVRRLHDQILHNYNSRDEQPAILLAGNKQDLLTNFQVNH